MAICPGPGSCVKQRVDAPQGSYPGYFEAAFTQGLAADAAYRNPFLQHVLLGRYRLERSRQGAATGAMSRLLPEPESGAGGTARRAGPLQIRAQSDKDGVEQVGGQLCESFLPPLRRWRRSVAGARFDGHKGSRL